MYDNSLGFGDISGEVHAVIDLFGVGDLAIQAEYLKKNRRLRPDAQGGISVNVADLFFGAEVLRYPHLAYFANPETWITPSMPPILLRMGAADQVVDVESSRRLAKRVEDVCGRDRVEYDEFPDYAHADERYNSPENQRRMWDWLKKALAKRS